MRGSFFKKTMFDKVKQGKQLMKMRSEAKKLQSELEDVTESVTNGNVHVKVNAAQRVEFIEINGERQKDVEDAINDAFKKVQKTAAHKMLQMEGGLSSLLGGMK